MASFRVEKDCKCDYEAEERIVAMSRAALPQVCNLWPELFAVFVPLREWPQAQGKRRKETTPPCGLHSVGEVAKLADKPKK